MKVLLSVVVFIVLFGNCDSKNKNIGYAQLKKIELESGGWMSLLFERSVQATISSRMEFPSNSAAFHTDARNSDMSIDIIDTVLKYNASKFEYRLSDDSLYCNIYFEDSLFISIDISIYDSVYWDGYGSPRIVCYSNNALYSSNHVKQDILSELKSCQMRYETEEFKPIYYENEAGEAVRHYVIWDYAKGGPCRLRYTLYDCPRDYVNDYTRAIESLIRNQADKYHLDRIVVCFPILVNSGQ